MKSNKVTYNEMIDLLKNKVHVAPNRWEQIEEDISFNERVSNLKQHTAPEGLWDKIESELDVELPVKKPQSFLKIIIGFLAIMILTYTTSQFFTSENTSQSFVYKSEIEIIDNELPEVETNTPTYESGVEFINTNEEAFSEENFSSYQKELDELESAVQKIKMMQGEYGEDASSLKMLSRLEREKAELIKNMINRA